MCNMKCAICTLPQSCNMKCVKGTKVSEVSRMGHSQCEEFCSAKLCGKLRALTRVSLLAKAPFSSSAMFCNNLSTSPRRPPLRLSKNSFKEIRACRHHVTYHIKELLSKRS